MNPHHLGKKLIAPAALLLALCLETNIAQAQNHFFESDLTSDIPGRAAVTDANLVNPWGIALGPTTPFWIADNGTGLTTLYNKSGGIIPLVVTIPGPGADPSAPTGAVFNGGSKFNGDRFLYVTEDGTFAGWRGALGTTAETLWDNSPSHAKYKGLAIGSIGADSYLYAANFTTKGIDVLGSTGAPALTGNFTDMTIPMGYSPFNIQNLGGQLFVTYALVGPTGDDVGGLGNGFVDVFDLNGDFVRRVASNGALDSPWGLAIAPMNFGTFGGDLLVGNFGNGMINVYDPMSGAWIDSLNDSWGNPITIDGLWGLNFGNGTANGGNAGSLYFTAGIAGPDNVEDHGLFGSISAVPEASTVYSGIALLGLCAVGVLRRRKQKA